MGCWNETCAVSGLPIPWRTPIRLFLMIPNTRALHESLWDFATPLPITGLYNDYGGIDHIEEGLISQLTLEYLKDNMATPLTEQEKQHLSCYATNVGKTEEDLSYLVSACSQEFFKFRLLDFEDDGGTVWKSASPEVVFVREDVYRLTQGFSPYWGRRHDYLERAWHTQQTMGAALLTEEAGEITDALRLLMDTQADQLPPLRILHSERKFTDEEMSQIKEEIRKQCDFMGGLNQLRRELSPKRPTSQRTDYDEHALFHEKLAEFARNLHEQETEDTV